jgi:hypothetical protein
MTAQELEFADQLEGQLLDWIEAGKGAFVAVMADHPDVPEVVWSELARSARNAGWTVIVTATMVVIEATGDEGSDGH